MTAKTVTIGGACGYWGESAMATPQLLTANNIQYIVYDYLAEITMSIMARAKTKNPGGGFATDFVSTVLQQNLAMVAEKKVRLVSNAGGINPEACGEAVRALIRSLGLDLKVAVISGDNILEQAASIAQQAPIEMFSGEPFPDPDKIASINTYLGAFPIAYALDQGADIVITGRCVDSAVTLGICIHEFGWTDSQFDKLASGSLAGHILECGPQATGGNFTDWELAGDIANIGYPIATIADDGSFEVTKPENTGGLVSIGTVSEQMLYEIGDPQCYILPDVVCDFSDVCITQTGPDRVSVSPAKGYPAPDTYKTCATFADGFRTGTSFTFYGVDAGKKARAFAQAAFERANKTLRGLNAAGFTETSIEVIGADSQYGAFTQPHSPREVVTKIAAKHPTMIEGGILLKELSGLGLACAPGLSGFRGAVPKPSPVVRLFSYLTPKADIDISVDVDGEQTTMRDKASSEANPSKMSRPVPPAAAASSGGTDVPLIKMAWARSGDKGNKANIGIIARHADYLPWIWAGLNELVIAERFAHFIDADDPVTAVERFYLPGSNAMNILIDKVLGGGGVASIRNDPQGKGYAQILLACPISVPQHIADRLT